MTRVGGTADGFQHYTFADKPFKGVLADVRFDVVGADHRVRDYRVQVVPSPSIVEVKVTGQRPAYTDLLPVTHPWSPGLQLEMGTQVTLHARANKDLRVHILDPTADTARHLAFGPPAGTPARKFDFAIGKLERDAVMDITLEDTDGIASQRRIASRSMSCRTSLPMWMFRCKASGRPSRPMPACRSPARSPTTTQSTEPGSTWRRLRAPHQFPCRIAELGVVGDSLDLRAQRSASEDPLALEEGGKLLLTVKAVDKCDLHGQPNLGQGDVYELDVVSPSDLLALLEARELGLRRDFERAIDEMKDARTRWLQSRGRTRRWAANRKTWSLGARARPSRKRRTLTL